MRAAALALLVGCAGPPELVAERVPGGVEVRADRGLDAVSLLRADGVPVVSARPGGAERALLLAAEPGVAVEARAGAAVVRVALAPPEPSVWVEAPAGQGARRVRDGERVVVPIPAGGAVEASIAVDRREDGPVALWVGGALAAEGHGVAGSREVARVAVGGEVPVRARVGDEEVGFTLVGAAVAPDELAARLRIVDLVLPADALGHRDLTRPADRIALPARWWARGLVDLGLGLRPRDDQAPWTWQAVTVENTGPDDLVVAIRASVEAEGGAAAEAFRSRVREAALPGGEVATLLRVPAGGRSVGALPLFVDREAVRPGAYVRRVRVAPLGAEAAAVEARRPLAVRVGSGWTSAGFAAALGTSGLGLLWLAVGTRRWLRALATTELVTIALFASLTFVVAAAARLLGYGLASVLGPFAPFLTGLLDDAFRVALLAALLTLVPRPGAFALATLTGYLLRGLALGSFHPVDLLYLGNVVLWHEAALWLAGPTRDPSWREAGPTARFLRLALAFGPANALSAASGLVTSMVLYRLYLADGYVAALIAGPGLLYVVLGCALAVPFAAPLRRVAT